MNDKATPRYDIVQIGPCPPPYGGISIHIRRLHKKLLAEGFSSQVLDVSSIDSGEAGVYNFFWLFFPVQVLKRLFRPTVFHLHGNNFYFLFVLSLFSRLFSNIKPVWTVHNIRILSDVKRERPWSTIALKMLDRRIPVFIVSKSIEGLLRELGITNPIRLASPFLKPLEEEKSEDIPREIEEFLEHRSPTLLGVVTKIVDYGDGDLYGLDRMILLADDLKDKYPDFGLLIILMQPSPNEDDYFRAWRAKLEESAASENVLIFNRALNNPVPVMRHCDLVLRPSRTDGNSLLVLEALDVERNVVASDCTNRPGDCILFQDGDQADFKRAVIEALDRERTEFSPVEDSFREYVEVYERLFNKTGK